MYFVVLRLHNSASELCPEDAYLNVPEVARPFCGFPQSVQEHVRLIDCVMFLLRHSTGCPIHCSLIPKHSTLSSQRCWYYRQIKYKKKLSVRWMLTFCCGREQNAATELFLPEKGKFLIKRDFLFFAWMAIFSEVQRGGSCSRSKSCYGASWTSADWLLK